jgi:L-iditol 2-dehydrogenase
MAKIAETPPKCLSRPNIGVFTDPDHNIYINPASPSIEELASSTTLKEGEVAITIRSTGICG